MPPDEAPRSLTFSPLDPRRARNRFFVAIAAGIAAGVLAPKQYGLSVRAVAGWDVGAIVAAVLAWWIILRSDSAHTKRRAAAEDPGRSAVWALVLLASTFSLFAAIVLMRRAQQVVAPGQAGLMVGLCLAAVISAWVLTHTSYTLRYAHLYYRDDEEGEGGLTFPCEGKDTQPNDCDFAYFAFTIGMCFQVSDVTICSRAIRRAVLGHALLSFAYNTTVLALALNLLFGVVS